MKQLQVIQQGLKAPKNQKNNFGNYKYRKAEDILASVKPLLGECTVILSDEIVMISCDEDRVVKLKTDKGRNVPPEIEYRTIHVSGRYFLKATAKISDGAESLTATGWAEIESHEGMSKEQCLGAASSYARKYALCGLFGIDDSSNDPDAIDTRPRILQSEKSNQTSQPVDYNSLTNDELIKCAIDSCKTLKDLEGMWYAHENWQKDPLIVGFFNERKNNLKK